MNKERHQITNVERKKYLLSVDSDYHILDMCKQLEQSKLTKKDRTLVALIKSQLEKDWRKPLLHTLTKLIRLNRVI